MKKEEMSTFVGGMQSKIGEETSALIADDLGRLITDNSQMVDTLESKEQEIEKLRKEKENLIAVNGNLLQQVGMGEESKVDEEPSKKKQFNYRDAFDEKGNFKK